MWTFANETRKKKTGCGLRYYLEDHHRFEKHSAASENEALFHLSSG